MLLRANETRQLLLLYLDAASPSQSNLDTQVLILWNSFRRWNQGAISVISTSMAPCTVHNSTQLKRHHHNIQTHKREPRVFKGILCPRFVTVFNVLEEESVATCALSAESMCHWQHPWTSDSHSRPRQSENRRYQLDLYQ